MITIEQAREYLAAPEQSELQDAKDTIELLEMRIDQLEAPEQSEPWKHDCAALLTNDVELWIDQCPHCGRPRTAAPQPTELSDDEIKDLWSEAHDDTSPQMPYQTFARAVLAAQRSKT